MRDATRNEAIQWCIDNNCDFRTPVFPPPEGWMWADAKGGIILMAIFTNTDDADITALDVGARTERGLA